jgi:hypothetical protein
VPLFVLELETGATPGEIKRPAFTHFPALSSYFIHPPLFREAHQPVGAA